MMQIARIKRLDLNESMNRFEWINERMNDMNDNFIYTRLKTSV